MKLLFKAVSLGVGFLRGTRGFQWNNPQARDAIFGNTIYLTLLSMICLKYVLVIGLISIGGDGADDNRFFNDLLDIYILGMKME